jgi:ubiquinone/menaquinone biosynthesis C-methylase UbiE
MSIHPSLVDSLYSPTSGAKLSLADNQEYLTNNLGESFPLRSDIPRFVSDEHLASFGIQWTTYEVAHQEEDEATFQAKTGFKLAELTGKKILDAGCGGGRYCKVAGEAGGHVIGVDHTRAVEKAQMLCNHLSNVNFVQADLKHLPFAPASFDFAFSIGVMHHDVDTRAVFDSVARFVKPGGKYSVWLYRKNQSWQEYINNYLRKRTITMQPKKLEDWCKWGAFLGGIPLINRTLNKIVNFSSHPNYENRLCDTFDWYAPQYQHHHTVAELLDWFHAAGFADMQVLPPEKTGSLYRYIYEKNLLIGSGVNVTATKK